MLCVHNEIDGLSLLFQYSWLFLTECFKTIYEHIWNYGGKCKISHIILSFQFYKIASCHKKAYLESAPKFAACTVDELFYIIKGLALSWLPSCSKIFQGTWCGQTRSSDRGCLGQVFCLGDSANGGRNKIRLPGNQMWWYIAFGVLDILSYINSAGVKLISSHKNVVF